MDTAIIGAILLSIIRLTPPVFIAGIGNMYCERVGILNLGAGGMMITGAFSAVLGSYMTGSPWVGLLCGILGGGLSAVFYGIVCVEFGGMQAIAGLGLNLFAAGFTTFLCSTIFNAKISPQVANLNQMEWAVNIPIIGNFMSKLSPIILIGIVIAIASHYFMFKTPLGLRMRAIGDNPKVVETAGIDVWKTKYFGVIMCGLICGMAGAYLSIGALDRFIINMVSGRGMLAVIAVKMGKWNPLGILGTALLLGTFDALQLQLQLNNFMNIPVEIIQIIPFVAGITVLAFQHSSDARPSAIEIPYLKNKYKI